MMKETTSEKPVKPGTDLGILIGLLLTDGCVASEGKVILINKSEALHSLFKEKIKIVFNHEKFITAFNKSGVKRTEVNSKWIVTELLKFTPTFRTRQFDDGSFPSTKIPEFIFELPKQDIAKILQAMFSADGSATISVKWEKRRKKFVLRRRVKLASKHPKLKEQISSLLQKFGFHPRIHSDSVVLERKEDLTKFQKEVRFVDGVKVTKNGIWSGMDKNDVLDILVKTFEIPQSFIDKFSSKEEIINFLKTLQSASPTRSAGRLTGRERKYEMCLHELEKSTGN